MRKFDSLILLRLMAMAMLLSTAVPYAFSQHFANASTTRSHSFRNIQLSDLHPREAGGVRGEEIITLKEVLQDLKRRYHFKFAYREGLLDGKVVPSSMLDNGPLAPEAMVEKILEQCQLQYKQISKKQFTIFSSEENSNFFLHEKSAADLLTLIQPATSPGENAITEIPAITISGTVTAQDDGQSIPGVNVVVKGTTVGTTTDAQGKYTLTSPNESGVLVFSFIGYATQEISFNNQTIINASMSLELQTLNEVVVTALGIEKEKKALAYSVSEVNGDEFTQARENNVANALSGKIAGVNATGISTGPGGSSRVIIRGNGSLTGANQPLYVINGMPIDNSTPGGSATTNDGTSNVDRGDGISAINPDDIETISVLKGGTAAALYGSRAANGVILITTKKGRAQKGVGVEYNSTFTMEKAAVFPDWQYEYGQGDNGVKPTTKDLAISTGRTSFGAKIDGSDFVAADGLTHPYVAQKDNIKNFYQTGTSFTNTLAFVGGSQTLNYRFSVSDLNSRSILPNSTYKRKTANLNLNGKFGEKITVQAQAQYNLEKAHNRPSAGDALGNPNWTPYMLGNTTDIRWLSPGYDANGNEIAWNDAAIASNSYFVVNKYQEDDTKNRFIGQASIAYDILKNFTVKGVVSRDFYGYNYTNVLPTGALYTPNGEYRGLKTDVAETNSMLTASYNTHFASHFNVSVLAGANRRRFEYKELKLTGSNFTIPYFYSFTNLSTASTKPLNQRTETNSIFGSVDLDFKNLLFLTFTGRQDWFSTLSPAHNSIFYPSIGGSFALSDAMQMPAFIDFAKFRASWAQVGGSTPDPYAINPTYSMVASSGSPLQIVTQDAVTNTNTITNANLRPLTSTTYEAGFEIKMLQNRLSLDVTYYDRKTTDDIVKTTISGTSGYNSVILNIGELSNKGIELLIGGTPVKSGNFTWDVSYNVAYNKNEVVKLADGLNSIQMATSVGGWAYINNIAGQSYGTIVGTKMKRDDNNNVVFNPTSGLPVIQTGVEFGKGVPPLTMGLTNEFKYKNFSLNFLIDGKFGNKVFSILEVYATRKGLMKSTLPGRENGLELNGVTPEGAPYSRVVPINGLRSYYDNYKTYSELFIHDGSFVKLRQVIFSYKIPVSGIKFVKIQSANISFVARNLLTLYKKTDNFDPEQSFTNGPAQGLESFGLPRTRSYGVNLMVKF